ncbi:MAG: tetratricopeptide repeat protein [Gemmatimonadetes bacterium]|nr:tetratricopeptide repeat protein [Gemmatimonadota bacterium]
MYRTDFDRRGLVLSSVIALTFLASAMTPAAAQSTSRFAVLVPPFENATGGRPNFGRDVANEVGKLLDNMGTHRPVDRAVLRDALRKYELKEEDLGKQDCIPARQLATHIDVQLVMCGAFTERGRDDYEVAVRVISPAAAEESDLPPFRAANAKQAAQQVYEGFQRFVQGLSFAAYCGQYSDSQNWESAIENCNKALEFNPRSKGALYGLAYAKWKTADLQAAHDGFAKVLDIDPLHQESMLALGLVASEMGNKDEGLRWFHQYLELNPGNVAVRLTVATEAAKAGNSEAALAILEEGMKPGEQDLELFRYAGLFAMNAAAQKNDAGNGTMAEARPLLEKALKYLEPVLQAEGKAADPNVSLNILQALRLLEQNDRATAFGATAVQNYPDNAQIWSAYADVLNSAGRTADALAALDRVAAIDPNAQVNARRAVWQIDAGDIQGAIAAARVAMEKSELTDAQVDVVAQKIISAGYELHKQKQYQAALQHYESAEPFARTDRTKGMKAFFHAYALYLPAAERANRQTLEDARATKPIFERILSLMQAAGPYCESSPQSQNSCREIVRTTNEQIEIQDLIIKRGR